LPSGGKLSLRDLRLLQQYLPEADMLGSHASAQSVVLAVGFAFYSD
jgi:hypothetical protein